MGSPIGISPAIQPTQAMKTHMRSYASTVPAGSYPVLLALALLTAPPATAQSTIESAGSRARPSSSSSSTIPGAWRAAAPGARPPTPTACRCSRPPALRQHRLRRQVRRLRGPRPGRRAPRRRGGVGAPSRAPRPVRARLARPADGEPDDVDHPVPGAAWWCWCCGSPPTSSPPGFRSVSTRSSPPIRGPGCRS